MVNPTLYDILGVRRDASRDEVKLAWRDAADRFEPGPGGSPAQFRMFNEAAEVLLDPERRKAYDGQLTEQQPQPDAQPDAQPDPEPEVATQPQVVATAAPDVVATPAPDVAGGRGVPIAALAALALLAAVAVGGASYVGARYQSAAADDARTTAYERSLEQAPAAAERAATAILSYDYESLDADRDAASRFLTPAYKDDYVTTFDSLVKESATQTKANVEATVLASSAMLQAGDQDPDRVPVLLFVDQTTVSTANSGEPGVALNRVRLDLVRVDGTWLVDGITSY